MVVATYKRASHIPELLEALRMQTRPAAWVVIVDATPLDSSCRFESSSKNVTVLISERASLTFQKNLAIDYLLKNCGNLAYIAVLDDDVRPGPDYLERLTNFLGSHPGAVGCCGTDGHARKPSKSIRFLNSLFLLSGKRDGSVLKSGVNVPVYEGVSPLMVEWLLGCSVWRSNLFRGLRYEAAYHGNALGEDVEFSQRAKQFGELYVLPEVHLTHLADQQNRPNDELFYYRLARSRFDIARLNSGPFVAGLAFLWSSVGQLGQIAIPALWEPSHLGQRLRKVFAYLTGIRDSFQAAPHR